MKKSLLVSLATLGVLAMAGSALAINGPINGTNNTDADKPTIGGTGIRGTKHDLSVTTGAASSYKSTTEDEICIFCHAPHNTANPASYASKSNYIPLWNKTFSATTTFTMYTAGTDLPDGFGHMSTSTALLAGVNEPGGVSKLCLSCHDGSVGVNEYGAYGTGQPGATPGTGQKIQGGGALIGNNGILSNHHPVGFSYSDALTDEQMETNPELADLATPVGGHTIADLLYSGKMECVTCHDVHNSQNNGEKFLWETNANSNFCCTCHLKCN